MSQPESYNALQREWQKKRQQRLIAEKEERLLEERMHRAAKLERSLSTQAPSFQQHRVRKASSARRQSAGANIMRNAQRSPVCSPMNRSLTVQPTTSPMDSVPLSSMPMIQEYGGMATGMMNRLSQDEPANVFLLRASRPEVGASSYPAPDVGTNPLEYLAGVPSEEEFTSNTVDFFYPPPESATPSLVSGGESAATPMSREPSSVSGSYLMTQELARSESNLSPAMEQWPSQEMYSITNAQQTQHDAKSLCVDNDMFAGMGSSFPAAAESVPMSRSISTSSTSSTRSTASKQGERAKEAHERHIQNGLRNNNLAPKPSDDAEKADSSSTNTASKKDGKVAVAKNPYQRPIKDRVFCKKCNDHPGGFRGQHELSRHDQAKHADVVTRYQVRDPRKAGITTSLTPLTSLEKCKACQTKKMYGAYYNVAAHLRRSHFRIKRRKQGKKQNLQTKIERLGKDEPPMAELKKWMIEVKVRGGEAPPLDDDFPDVDETLDFDCSLDMSIPGLAVSPETNSSISSGSPYEMPLEMPMGLMAADSGFVDYVEAPFVSGRSLDYSDLANGFAMAPLGVVT